VRRIARRIAVIADIARNRRNRKNPVGRELTRMRESEVGKSQTFNHKGHGGTQRRRIAKIAGIAKESKLENQR